jgi:hypothetical protein
MKSFQLLTYLLVALLLLTGRSALAAGLASPAKGLAGALPPEKWSQVETSVDHALAWLAAQQAADGSFPTHETGQPAVTSLCVMAFLSRGYQPGFGPYGGQLNRAIDYVLSCQKADGLLCHLEPEANFVYMGASQTASYNHAISGLMLGEVYGHVSGERARKVKKAIARALEFTRALQIRRKAHALEAGGLRYVRIKPGGDGESSPERSDSDLSSTAWHLMFFRSAKNAEFNVPQKYVDEGVAYVRHCWDPKLRMFNYIATANGGRAASRGTTGAGILSLSMAGEHNSAMARAAGDWLVAHPFAQYDQTIGPYDRFFYSIYYCSQAAAQLGGAYWERIFPPIVDIFLTIQTPDGAFPAETMESDTPFGSTYTTAMAVLSLTPAYQLLPVYQR